MTDLNEEADAPYGLSELRSVPAEIFWLAALVGAASLLSTLRLGGAARGVAVLAGILLLDFAQEGLRPRALPFLRRRGRVLLAGFAAGLLLLAAARPVQLWLEKRAVLADTTPLGRLVVRETAQIVRRADLVVLPLTGHRPTDLPPDAATPAGQIAVYDGLERLSANLVPGKPMRLVVELGIEAGATKELDVYLGAADPAPDEPDPEARWSTDGAYTRQVQSLRFTARATGARDGAAPFLGRSYLEVEVAPLPGARPFAWVDLPVAGPDPVSEHAALLYAVRTSRPSSLDATVQLRTSAGYLYQTSSTDQEGLATQATPELQTRSTPGWYFRRIPLRQLAGARFQGLGLLVQHPDGWPAPGPLTVDLDAVRVVEGPPLDARFEPAS